MPLKQKRQKVAAVDFDGVLHKYRNGWQDGSIYDDPVAGSAEAMERLRREGYYVMIYSSRAGDRELDGQTHKGQASEVEDWLREHNIPFDEVWRGEKPIFDFLIDDRAIRFSPSDGGSRWRWLLGGWRRCLRDLVRLGFLNKRKRGEL